jgi:hypothetical protein
MQTAQSSTSTSIETNISINKGFMILEEKMLEFGYHYVVNKIDHLLFQKKGNDYDFFEIRISNDKLFVSIPIKNSRFQYKTQFTSYFEASEYVEMQLIDFESKNDVQVSKEKEEKEEEENWKDEEEE